jgi:hypothetical protein
VLLAILVLVFVVFPNTGATLFLREPQATPVILPVESNVELNQTQGFGFSYLVAGQNSSPMLVLPPGGSGTIPFTLSSPINEPLQVSLNIKKGSENATNSTSSVHFNISPANFTINPGQQASSTLTITVDQDALSAYYSPFIAIETNHQNSAPYVGGGPVDIPSLLIANQVPSCLYLVNEQLIPSDVLVMNTPSSGVATWPMFVPSPYVLPNVPSINLSPGQTTSVLFGCFKTNSSPSPFQSIVTEADPLNMNVTTPRGLTAEFFTTPTNIVWGSTQRIYSVTVMASSSLTQGTYQVKGQASLGAHLFDWQITYEVS